MKRGRPGKKIMCLNDSSVYSSVADAANTYDISCSAISQILHDKRNAVKGLHFISINGNETDEELALMRCKALAEKCNIII